MVAGAARSVHERRSGTVGLLRVGLWRGALQRKVISILAGGRLNAKVIDLSAYPSDEHLKALTMQDSIIESKTINYILFMVFC